MVNPLTNKRLSLPPALRYPGYRNFWFGLFAAVSGFQIFQFGQLWLIHELTGSALYLGYVGVANALPAILLNLVGGVVADKFDKRKLIILTQGVSSTLVFVLGALTYLGTVRPWHVMVIAVFAGAVNAFNQPARYSLWPHLVDRRAIVSAAALNSVVWQATRIVAPAVAGGLIAAFGTAASFFLSGAGMLTFAFVIYRLRVPRIERQATGNPVRDVLDALRFISANSIFAFLIGMAFFTSFFGMAHVNQMPVFAEDILRIGPQGQGVLLSTSGLGSLITTLYFGSSGNVPYKGLVLIGGATISGLSITGFSLSSHYIGSYALAAAFMFAFGLSFYACTLTIMTFLQMMVPDQMRGRIMGIYGMMHNIPPLGGMYAGAFASLIGTPFAIAIGGILVTMFALGHALFNRQVRCIGEILTKVEEDA